MTSLPTQAVATALALVSLGVWGMVRHRDAHRAVLGAVLILPACALVLIALDRAAGSPAAGAADSAGLVLVSVAAAQVSIGLGVRGRSGRRGPPRDAERASELQRPGHDVPASPPARRRSP